MFCRTFVLIRVFLLNQRVKGGVVVVIQKILNNNVVIVKNINDEELILIGRGISFNKSEGDEISEEKVERKFFLDDGKNRRLLDLIKEIPEECFNYAEEIIYYGKDILKDEINSSIYLTLTDHINFLKSRSENGYVTRNPLKWEIRQYYPNEYYIGLKAVELLEESFTIEYKEEEAATIALHFVNAKWNNNMNDAMEMLELMDSIISIIKYQASLVIDEKDFNYQRLITHVKFFLQRVMIRPVKSNENPLHNIIKETYPKEYGIAKKIQKYVETQTKFTVTDDELTYLILHIKRVCTTNEEID